MRYDSIFRPQLFQGQVAIVTGGGSGIGRCTAHELSALGAKIALIGRDQTKLDTVEKEISAAGGQALALSCDIREETLVEATIARIIERFGRIDHLVNNAGGQFAAPLAGINQKGWESVVRTNLTGGFLVAKACYLQWMRNRGGAIVNIVADMWHGMPNMGHSGAARAGMVNFTETAALEWGSSGVRVNAVAPGWIASSGMERYPSEMRDSIRKLRQHVPLGRLGTESEVSAAIVFLLSPAAAFISGTTLRVDGAAPNARAHAAMTLGKPIAEYNGFHLASAPAFLKDS